MKRETGSMQYPGQHNTVDHINALSDVLYKKEILISREQPQVQVALKEHFLLIQQWNIDITNWEEQGDHKHSTQ